MSNAHDKVYNFAFKGLLTEETLDRAGRKRKTNSNIPHQELAEILAINNLSDDLVDNASKMAVVYTAIAAFENGARELVSGVLLETKGENWWEQSVSKKVRDRAESRQKDEQKIKWHTQRGDHTINYTEIDDLIKIIRNNWDEFEPFIQSVEWAASIFTAIERSRNVIMHSGYLEREDVERLGVLIRDWIKQVGA